MGAAPWFGNRPLFLLATLLAGSMTLSLAVLSVVLCPVAWSQTGAVAEAEQGLRLAKEGKYDLAAARYKLAQSLMWSQQYEPAIEEFRILLAKDPDSAPVHMLLGEVLDAANRIDEAIAEFEEGATAAPREPEVHFGLGYLYWKQKRYDDARGQFQAELNNQPNHLQSL